MTPRRMKSLTWRKGYLFFAAICLFAFAHTLDYSVQFATNKDQSGESVADLVQNGNLVRQIALIVLGCGSLLTLYLNRRLVDTWRTLANNRVYLILITLAFLSVAWADDPYLTFRRCAELLLISTCTFTLSKVTTVRSLLKFSYCGSLAFVGIGLLCEIFLSTFRPTLEDYRFCGTLHPNHQAWQCGLLVLSSSALAFETSRKNRRWYVCSGAFGFVLLLLTKSRTTLGAVLLGLITMFCLILPKARRAHFLALAIITVTLLGPPIALLGSSFGEIYKAQLAGRGEDSVMTLTGRLPLWSMALDFVAKRPLLGYGYYSFWTPDHIRYFSDEQGWGIPESHNGYIELLLSVGVMGLALYLNVVGRTFVRFRGLTRSSSSPSAISAFPVAMVVFFLLVMICDTIALDITLVTTIMFAFAWKAGDLPGRKEQANRYGSYR